jgi:uncharacterized protein YjbI with pentapeptide repeats
VTTPKP